MEVAGAISLFIGRLPLQDSTIHLDPPKANFLLKHRPPNNKVRNRYCF